MDTSMPFSILNQCKQVQTYELVQEQGGKPEGCGSEFAIIYYISYQIFVS